MAHAAFGMRPTSGGMSQYFMGYCRGARIAHRVWCLPMLQYASWWRCMQCAVRSLEQTACVAPGTAGS